MSAIAQTGLVPAQLPGDGTPPQGATWTIILANIQADFAFFRRSRLLLAFALAFLLLTGLSLLPTLFSNSGFERFNILKQVFETLNVFVLILSGGLGLFIVSSHLRDRSLKMVFTKPCSPGAWLISAFVSAGLVSFLLTAAVLAIALLFSAIWHVPVQAGLVFLSLNIYVTSLIVIAYTLLLGTLVHPALAVTLILIFNSGVFFSMQEWAQATIRSGNGSTWLRVLEKVFYVLYLIVPMYGPYDDKTRTVASTFRASAGDWKYLAYSLGYALVFSAFCYFLALLALYKKRHI